MLTVYRSNRAEWLAKLLSEQLRISPPLPFEEINIIVNTWPTSRWLGEQISLVNGINAQINFPFPGSYLENLAQKILGEEHHAKKAWKANELVWTIIDILPELLQQNEAEALRDWINNNSSNADELSQDKWQLAKIISGMIDEYILYRPNLINQWYQSESINSRQLGSIKDQDKWQAILIGLLKEKIELEPFSIQVKKVINSLESDCFNLENIPKKLYVFGITNLAPLQHELIQALSKVIDIQIYLLTPCRDLWQRYKQRRDQIGEQWRSLPNGSWLLDSPRLEATLGRMGSEFQQLLEGTGEYQLGEWSEQDLFALPVKMALNKSQKPTLLEQIQERLVTQAKSNNFTRLKTDNSLLFIECPGIRRQVQIIRDQILQLMSQDKELQPRDILIMTPQVEIFAPFISSSLNDIATTKVEIPWIITDRSQQEEPGLIKYMLELLDLASTRLTASKLDKFLSNPAIQKQKGITPEEIIKISTHLQNTGFRWGLDERERNGERTHSLSWCLDRWLLGLVLPSDPGIALSGVAPFSKGISSNEFFKWWDLISNLYKQLHLIRRPKNCIDWIETLKEVLETTFTECEELEWERKKFLSALEDWKLVAVNCNLKLPSIVVKDILNQYLNRETSRYGHRSGKLTISALEPMRAIPHKVIILMGLDEKIYPRREVKPSFNLIAQRRQLGDPRDSDRDRYALLEAIMSSRKNLIIAWNCRNEKTGELLEVSSPIRHWLDYLKSELDDESYKGLILNPPANPLDRENFLNQNGRPAISCDSRSLEARKLIDKKLTVEPVAIAMPLQWSKSTSPKLNDISNEILTGWLTQPQIKWLERYQLKPKEWQNPINDIEDLRLNELLRYQLLKQRLEEEDLKQTIHPVDELTNSILNYWENHTLGQGLLPSKSAGLVEIALLETRWSNLQKTIKNIGPCCKKIIDLNYGSKEFLIADDYLISIEIGKLKNKGIMSGWVDHLEICASGNKIKGSILISRKSNEEFEKSLIWKALEMEEAKEILQELKAIAQQGLNQCWPVPPESGWALAKAKKDSPGIANKAFQRSWEGEYKVAGERKKSEMQLCFGVECDAHIFLENENFQTAFSLLYEPLTRYLIN